MKHKALAAIKAFNCYYEAPMSAKNLRHAIGGSLYRSRKVLKELKHEELVAFKSIGIWSEYYEKALPANGYMITEKGNALLEDL
ncbi:MAG: hypothetical protein JXR88_12475 [Clostridia bacterium]|nr:hypothetical protein [Clostridia bacterium]